MLEIEKNVDHPPAAPFAPERELINPAYMTASVDDVIKDYLMHLGYQIDPELNIRKFSEMVDQLSIVNTNFLHTVRISSADWDAELLDKLDYPARMDGYEFTGLGFGNCFRAAVSMPENYAVISRVQIKLFGTPTEVMDVDYKLPIRGSFLEYMNGNFLPNFLSQIAEVCDGTGTFGNDSGIVFTGMMDKTRVTLNMINLPHISALEIRLHDTKKKSTNPDMTIHVTKYQKDARVGDHMPQSLNNAVLPVYINTRYQNAEIVIKEMRLKDLQEMYKHPEIIDHPEHAGSMELLLLSGLRAIAEKMQHMKPEDYSRVGPKFMDILYGDWWKKYKEVLLDYAQNHVSNSNDFMEGEIVSLFIKLNDFRSDVFLRMAYQMGIMDVLFPEFSVHVYNCGYMHNGPDFHYANPEQMDYAIYLYTTFNSTFLECIKADEDDLDDPRQLGSVVLMEDLERIPLDRDWEKIFGGAFNEDRVPFPILHDSAIKIRDMIKAEVKRRSSKGDKRYYKMRPLNVISLAKSEI